MKTDMQTLSRRMRRDQRREKMRNLTDLVKRIKLIPGTRQNPSNRDAFAFYWPVIRTSLELVETAGESGSQYDEEVRALIFLGDKFCAGAATEEEITRLRGQLCERWNRMKFLLEMIIIFSGQKTDYVLSRVIEIGDWMVETEENHLTAA